MTKLTIMQQLVLASAFEQEAGFATRPIKLNTTAAAKVAASLVDRGYMRECASKAGQPIWRTDANGRTYSLKILKAGRIALKAIAEARVVDTPPSTKPVAVATQRPEALVDAPRSSSKIAGILVHLENAEGVTASEMIISTGWLPHTLRAALTGLRKRGYIIERIRKVDGATAYRLGGDATIAGAA